MVIGRCMVCLSIGTISAGNTVVVVHGTPRQDVTGTPGLVEFQHRGVEATFDRSDRNAKDVCCFPVLQTLMVDQHEGRPKRLRQVVDSFSNPFLGLLSLELFIGGSFASCEHLNERTEVVLTRGTVIEAHHTVTPVPPLGVDGLVGCDRVEPRANPPPLLEMLLFQMYLQEGGLKDVLSHFGTAQVPPEVTEQLPLIAVDEGLKGLRASIVAKPPEQFLVGRNRTGVACSSMRDPGRGTMLGMGCNHRGTRLRRGRFNPNADGSIASNAIFPFVFGWFDFSSLWDRLTRPGRSLQRLRRVFRSSRTHFALNEGGL